MNTAIIDPKYRIGIDAMDAQHARWITLIERFRAVAAVHLLDAIGLNAARVTLGELLSYTQAHFSSEEELLKRYRYPALAEHVRKHQELVRHLTDLRDEISAHQTASTPMKLNLVVNIWLLEHILRDDDDYANFILARA